MTTTDYLLIISTFGFIGSITSFAVWEHMHPKVPSANHLNNIANSIASDLSFQTITLQNIHGSFMGDGVTGVVQLSPFDNLYYDSTNHLFFENGRVTIQIDVRESVSIPAYTTQDNIWQRTGSPSHSSKYLINSNQPNAIDFNDRFKTEVDNVVYKNFNPQHELVAKYVMVGFCIFTAFALAGLFTYLYTHLPAQVNPNMGGL